MMHQRQELGLCSMAVVEAAENAFEITAGPRGLEALVLEFSLDYE